MSQIATELTALLLNEPQAARLLTLSVRTLQAWRVKGEGPPFVRLGRAIRYRRPDIVQWLEARTRQSTNDDRPTATSGFQHAGGPHG